MMPDNKRACHLRKVRDSKGRRGQALVMVTFGIVFLMGVLGLVMDVGWGYYRKQVAQIVGNDIASKLPEFWGLNKDGDVRGFMQENRPGLWMIGGTAPQARWTSRFVAMAMMLDLLGVDNVVK